MKTCFANFGVDHPMQSTIVMAKSVATSWLRYGVSHPSKTDENIAKIKATKLERYGDESYCNSEQISKTTMERYGVPWSQMNPEIRAKSTATIQRLHGSQYTNAAQVPEIKALARKNADISIFEKYGVENVSHIPYFCGQCDKGGFGMGNLKRWHKGHMFTSLVLFGEKVYHYV